MNSLSVLFSEHTSKNYFKNATVKPDVTEHKETDPNGDERHKWIFSRGRFEYKSFSISIPTATLLDNILDCDEDDNIYHPIDARHSGNFLKYWVTKDDKWHAWIPLSRVKYKKYSPALAAFLSNNASFDIFLILSVVTAFARLPIYPYILS